MAKIESLTPEQEALIPIYREKWRNIALSTERIDRQKATEAIKAAYTLMHKGDPEILFFNSPHAALEAVLDRLGCQPNSPALGKQLSHKLTSKISDLEDNA